MAINKVTKETVELFNVSGRAIDLYRDLATSRANYPGKGTALGLVYIAGKMHCEAGECSEKVLKAMRDDNLIPVYDATNYDDGHETETTHFAAHLGRALTPERRAAIINEAGDVLWYLAALAGELGLDLSDFALANLEKLADRTERGTLQGQGDER